MSCIRWMYRGLLLMLLLVSIAAWIWSYPHSIDVSYANPGGPTRRGSGWEAAIADGSFILYLAPNGGSGLPDGWDGWVMRDPTATPIWWRDDKQTKHFLGFFFRNQEPEPGLTLPLWDVGMPMWFPTAFLGVSLAWSFRKSRWINPKRAFPVQPPNGKPPAETPMNDPSNPSA